MRKEIPFEENNILKIQPQRGVRAHTILPDQVKKAANVLVDEAIEWGGGGGDRKLKIQLIEVDINQVVARHNTEHGHLKSAVEQLFDAKKGADLAYTNPLLTSDIVTNRLAGLDEEAWQAFRKVSISNIALKQYRLNEGHALPSSIKIRPQQKDLELP